MEITKESEKLLYCMYNIYLERRKSGVSRANAKEFEDGFYKNDKHLMKWNDSDVSDCLNELQTCGYIRIDILDNAFLEDTTINYMENRFKNGAKEVLELLTNFLS